MIFRLAAVHIRLISAAGDALDQLGSLSSDDGNGNKNVTSKYNFVSFVLLLHYFNSLN